RDFELHLLVLFEVLVARPCDSTEVNEDVGPAAILGDEPEPLLSVEPFHCSCCHVRCLPRRCRPTAIDSAYRMRRRSHPLSPSVLTITEPDAWEGTSPGRRTGTPERWPRAGV